MSWGDSDHSASVAWWTTIWDIGSTNLLFVVMLEFATEELRRKEAEPMKKERPPLFERLEKALDDGLQYARGELNLKTTVIIPSPTLDPKAN